MELEEEKLKKQVGKKLLKCLNKFDIIKAQKIIEVLSNSFPSMKMELSLIQKKQLDICIGQIIQEIQPLLNLINSAKSNKPNLGKY